MSSGLLIALLNMSVLGAVDNSSGCIAISAFKENAHFPATTCTIQADGTYMFGTRRYCITLGDASSRKCVEEPWQFSVGSKLVAIYTPSQLITLKRNGRDAYSMAIDESYIAVARIFGDADLMLRLSELPTVTCYAKPQDISVECFGKDASP
jgi:hypothetical protein